MHGFLYTHKNLYYLMFRTNKAVGTSIFFLKSLLTFPVLLVSNFGASLVEIQGVDSAATQYKSVRRIFVDCLFFKWKVQCVNKDIFGKLMHLNRDWQCNWFLILIKDRLQILFLILSELIIFCSLWKHQRTYDFLMISGVIEVNLLNIGRKIWRPSFMIVLWRVLFCSISNHTGVIIMLIFSQLRN